MYQCRDLYNTSETEDKDGPVLKEYPENPKGRKVVLRSRDLCDEGRKVQRSEGLESASAAHSGALRGECASVHWLEFPVFVPSALE